MAQLDTTPTYTADDSLDLCSELAAACSGGEGVRAWLERERPHLLRAYDADFLVQAIETAKERCHSVMLRRRSVTHIGRAASAYASYAAA